jgi:hypothetical protein
MSSLIQITANKLRTAIEEELVESKIFFKKQYSTQKCKEIKILKVGTFRRRSKSFDDLKSVNNGFLTSEKFKLYQPRRKIRKQLGEVIRTLM